MCLCLFHLLFFVTVCVNVRIALRMRERCVSFGDCVRVREFCLFLCSYVETEKKVIRIKEKSARLLCDIHTFICRENWRLQKNGSSKRKFHVQRK